MSQRAVARASCELAMESATAFGTHGTSSGARGIKTANSTPPIAIAAARPPDRAGSGALRAGRSRPPDSK